MSKKLLFLIVITLIAGRITSQLITEVAKPKTVGFSAERLKRIDANLNECVTKGWMNGAVAMIVRNGKIGFPHGLL